MKMLAYAVALSLVPAFVAAETVRSQSLEVDMVRRVVSMTSQTGTSIQGEQVYVTLRRLDGQAIAANDLQTYVPFAERAACQGRKVMVSLMVGAPGGEGKYEVLCASKT